MKEDRLYNLWKKIEADEKFLAQFYQQYPHLSPQKKTHKSIANREIPRTKRLICINDGIIDYEYYNGDVVEQMGDGLEYCKIYHGQGPEVGNEGQLYYFIFELGTTKLAQRFVELKPKRGRPRKK